MTNIKNSFCLIIMVISLCICCNAAPAQDLPGKLDTIYSNILKEKRVIRVVLPDGYKPGSADKYDVIYVLDGSSNIKTVYRVQRYLQDEEFMPPAIIVSV